MFVQLSEQHFDPEVSKMVQSQIGQLKLDLIRNNNWTHKINHFV